MVEEKKETEKKNAATEEIKEEPEATEEPEKPRKSRMDGVFLLCLFLFFDHLLFLLCASHCLRVLISVSLNGFITNHCTFLIYWL